MMRSRVINSVGAVVTGVVLVIVLVSKFASGAWIVVVAMPVIWLMMRGIHRHYNKVAVELAPPQDGSAITLPARNRAIVLVSKLHLPAMRALAYARATRPSYLEAVTVEVDAAETRKLVEDWERAEIPVPLTIVASPYREITKPVLDYVRQLRRDSQRDVVTVYVPEYVLGRWWKQLLHNQSAFRLKTKLLMLPGVVIANVPYQLRSAVRKTPVLETALPLGSWQAIAGEEHPEIHGQERPRGARPGRAPLPMLKRLTADTGTLHAEELRVQFGAEFGEGSAIPIAECGDRGRVEVAGTLRTLTVRPRGNVLTMEADLWDGTGRLTLIWLGRREIAGVEPGRRMIARGTVTNFHGERAIYNPKYELR